MDKSELTNTEPAQQGANGTARLAYEAPVLIAYNPSEITMGGAKTRTVDFVGGGTTSYKS